MPSRVPRFSSAEAEPTPAAKAMAALLFVGLAAVSLLWVLPASADQAGRDKVSSLGDFQILSDVRAVPMTAADADTVRAAGDLLVVTGRVSRVIGEGVWVRISATGNFVCSAGVCVLTPPMGVLVSVFD
jgi:hypothetical protein